MPFDAFLKIDGVEGETTDDKHKSEIEILEYKHGVTQAVTGSVSSTGNLAGQRCSMDAFIVKKQLDKATPLLSKFCATGKVFPLVTLTLCRAGGAKEQYMQYKLTNVIISNIKVGGNSNKYANGKDDVTTGGMGGVPIEEVSFNFTKIEWQYTVILPSGSAGGQVTGGWDLAINKEV